MIKNVPTNIITGFLGSGKTTVIQHLLKNKPTDERWAVLVNEFGEIGIDGAFLNQSLNRNQNMSQSIFIREVPGGCMCCTSGLPMQIALNQLLAKAQPDRLLIEPTGLGHPQEVLASLSAEHYRQILDIRATLTLVDARKITDQRWRDHPSFQQQLHMADHIVASKADLYQGSEIAQLKAYLAQHDELAKVPLSESQQGELPTAILAAPSSFVPPVPPEHDPHHHHSAPQLMDVNDQLQQDGQVQAQNKGDGFISNGWAFAPERVFDFNQVMSVLTGVTIERLKAVMITERGIFAFNLVDGVLSVTELDESDQSRLEFITSDPEQAQQLALRLEQELLTSKPC